MANRTIADLIGTFSNIFQLGKGGPKVKNNAGVLEVRNAADNAYANLVVAALTAAGINVTADQIVINSDATSAGADWKLFLARSATGMTHDITVVFPPGDPAVGQALTVASFTSNIVTLQYTTIAAGTDKVVVDTTALAFGDTSPKAMFTLPANAVVQKVQVIVDTAFNTAATLSVGITGTVSKYMGTGDLDLQTVGSYDVTPKEIAVGTTEALIATYAAAAASAGAARILVTYVIPS